MAEVGETEEVEGDGKMMVGSRNGKRLVRGRVRLLATVAATVTTLGAFAVAAPASAGAAGWLDVQSLDGQGNNKRHPDWGSSDLPYARTAPVRYADSRNTMVGGPNSRYLSNRVFNDTAHLDDGAVVGVDVFSEHQVSQWGWAWGQFVDHTIAMRLGVLASHPHGEATAIPTVPGDPYEPVRNQVQFTRSAVAPGSGVTSPRQQVNAESSYLDGSAVYGTTPDRLEWLREGPVDGDLSNNGARLLLPDDYLPVRGSRGAPASAPEMDLGGPLARDPIPAVVAGDARANNNILITGIQTLFAREHNRIVGQLPATLSEEMRFQIARRVVISEIQYITYQEFLPAMGIVLPAYRSYDQGIDPTLSNEFATVGYRAHSIVHSNIPVETSADRYTEEELEALRRLGAEVRFRDDTVVKLIVKMTVAQFNPSLVPRFGLGPLLQGVSLLPQYRNDEQVDFLLRDVLCPPTPGQPPCLVDLAAIDLQRGRDHGIASYNDLRRAYGLPPRASFTEVTGESSEQFPSDPLLTAGDELNDFDSLDYTAITTLFGSDVSPINGPVDVDFTAFTATRRTPLAARLKALYGSVDGLDALVGMLAEPHLPGSEFGELQQAIWTDQFRRLRDGDRFFYGNQRSNLDRIRQLYGIDFRHSLADLIAANTDISRAELPDRVFYVGGYLPPTACRIGYRVDGQTGTDAGTFTATVTITNTGRKKIDDWILRYRYADGQQVTEARNGVVAQVGTDVPITNTAATGGLAPGQTRRVRLSGSWSGRNPPPAGFTLNSTPCAAAR